MMRAFTGIQTGPASWSCRRTCRCSTRPAGSHPVLLAAYVQDVGVPLVNLESERMP